MMQQMKTKLLAVVLTLGWAGVAQAGNARPTVTWASDPVLPDEVVLVQGGGWGADPRVEVSVEAGAPVVLTPLEVRAGSVKFLLPKNLPPAIYRCRIISDGEKSEPFELNAPDVWWQQGDAGREASPGGWLGLFGKCLSFDQHATLLLRGAAGEVRLTPAQQECWSVRAELPRDLAPGPYRVWLDNGRGSPRETQPITIAPHAPPWKSDRFEVTDFGALPNDAGDDTAAIRAALAAAGKNGGGIVCFPRGRFRLTDMLEVPPHVLLQGAGRELTLLFWDDRNDPPPALIRGTHSFGVQDLSINSGFFRIGIQADNGEQPGAGHVFLQRLRLRLIKYPYLTPVYGDAEEFVRRWKTHGEGIQVGGDNVQVTDCDLQINGSPIGMSGCRYSRVAHNRFDAFKDGWSHIEGCEQFLFEDNAFHGGTCGIAPGALNAHFIYYARNQFDQTYDHDREGMTFDGGGHTYIGKIARANGTQLVTAEKVAWRWGSWVGGYVFLMNGTGAGQVRRIVRYDGNTIELDQPWTIPPDAQTEIHIAKFKGRCLFVGNEWSDVTIAIQLYGCSVDVIVADNVSRRSGGFNSHGLFKGDGPEPSWRVQYFGNQIVEGNGLRGPMNSHPPSDSALAILSRDRRNPYPLVRGAVVRRNHLHNNARIALGAGNMEDLVIENNLVEDADVGIEMTAIPGVLLRGNQFHNVRQPLAGKTGAAWMHPAERLLTQLGSADFAALEQRAPAAWRTARDRLALLTQLPAYDPALVEQLRATALTLLKEVAAADKSPVPVALWCALLGVEFDTQPGRDLSDAIRGGTGGAGFALVSGTAASWSPPFKLTLTANAAARTCEVRAGQPWNPRVPCGVAAGAWSAADTALTLAAAGDAWQLTTCAVVHDSVQRAIDEWMLAGPFPNVTGKLVDDAVHGPEKHLDLAADYDGLAGKVRWQPALITNATHTLDLAARFGADRPGVAYALAVLRAARPVTVNFRWANYLETMVWLNGRQIGTQWRLGNSPSVTVPAGDNVLLVMSGHQTKTWTLNFTVEPVGPLAPGDLQIVPASDFAKIAALHPPSSLPGAGALPFAEGVHWQLAFEDNFDRQRKGTDYNEIEGQWELHDGGIAAATLWTFLSPKLTLPAPVRIEFDVTGAAPKPGALIGVGLTPADRVGRRKLWGEPSGAGYFLTLGWHNRKAACLLREEQMVLSNDKAPTLEPGRTHHVTAQFIPPRVLLVVDGRLVLDHRDTHWLPGLDTLSLFGWTKETFDNLRIYTSVK